MDERINRLAPLEASGAHSDAKSQETAGVRADVQAEYDTEYTRASERGKFDTEGFGRAASGSEGFVTAASGIDDSGTADSDTSKTDRFYIVREDILPEAVQKTIQAKELLARGEVRTIHEAVEQVGLSRSAFYKYKDGIYPLNKLQTERIVTVSMDLEHKSGVLSRVLATLAGLDGNVLTIHQTIPLSGMANVVVSVDTSRMGEQAYRLVAALRSQDGVRRAVIIGQG